MTEPGGREGRMKEATERPCADGPERSPRRDEGEASGRGPVLRLSRAQFEALLGSGAKSSLDTLWERLNSQGASVEQLEIEILEDEPSAEADDALDHPAPTQSAPVERPRPEAARPSRWTRPLLLVGLVLGAAGSVAGLGLAQSRLLTPLRPSFPGKAAPRVASARSASPVRSRAPSVQAAPDSRSEESSTEKASGPEAWGLVVHASDAGLAPRSPRPVEPRADAARTNAALPEAHARGAVPSSGPTDGDDPPLAQPRPAPRPDSDGTTAKPEGHLAQALDLYRRGQWVAAEQALLDLAGASSGKRRAELTTLAGSTRDVGRAWTEAFHSRDPSLALGRYLLALKADARIPGQVHQPLLRRRIAQTCHSAVAAALEANYLAKARALLDRCLPVADLSPELDADQKALEAWAKRLCFEARLLFGQDPGEARRLFSLILLIVPETSPHYREASEKLSGPKTNDSQTNHTLLR